MWKRLVHFPVASPLLVILCEKVSSAPGISMATAPSFPAAQLELKGCTREQQSPLARTRAVRNAHGNTGPQARVTTLHTFSSSLAVEWPHLPHFCSYTSHFSSFTAVLEQPWWGKKPLQPRNTSSVLYPTPCQHSLISTKLHSLHSGLKRFKFWTLDSLMINIMEFHGTILSLMKITKSRIGSKQNLNIQNECLAEADLVQWISRFKYNRWKQKQKKHIWTKHFFFLQKKSL